MSHTVVVSGVSNTNYGVRCDVILLWCEGESYCYGVRVSNTVVVLGRLQKIDNVKLLN